MQETLCFDIQNIATENYSRLKLGYYWFYEDSCSDCNTWPRWWNCV